VNDAQGKKALYCDSCPGQINIWFGQNFNILGVLYEGKIKPYVEITSVHPSSVHP